MKNTILFFVLMATAFQPARSQEKTVISVNNKNWEKMQAVQDKDTTITDTTRIEIKADTVHLGSITIIQCHNCDDSGNKTTIHFNSDKKKRHLDNVDIGWWGFDLGINSFIDNSDYGSGAVNDFVQLGAGNGEATEDFFSLHTIKSVNVNIWPVFVKVNLIRHIIQLKTGIGIEMNNYRYTKNLTYVNELNKTYIKLDDVNFSKNKLFTEYLTIPVLLHLNTNPYHNSRAFRFSAGPTFGLLIKSRTKQKSDERGKTKNNDPFNLEKFRMGLRTEIGYGPINFYGAYSMTPIHKYGLKQYPFSIGISLIM